MTSFDWLWKTGLASKPEFGPSATDLVDWLVNKKAESIKADQDGASLVADDSDREWEVDAKRGNKKAGDDRGGENEILPEDAPSVSCDPK